MLFHKNTRIWNVKYRTKIIKYKNFLDFDAGLEFILYTYLDIKVE